MTDPVYVQPDGMRTYAKIHDEVVNGLSQLTGAAAPEAAGVQTSHGAIASAVSTALSGVLGSRQGTLAATGTSGSTIAELLQKAAQMYEHGDRKGAATLRAAAEALEGSGGGADMVSQVGQQVGQMAQSVAQPVQGLAQGLQQVPQQVMHGVQQIAQQVSQAAGTAGGKTPGDEEQAAAGGSSAAGRAPDLPPAERAEQAQTRR